MHHIVTSRFSISSRQYDPSFLTGIFPWRVIESATADKVVFHVAAFDLGIGQHDRVDSHLVAAKAALLVHESQLNSLCEDCKYALWVSCRLPATEAAFNISHSVSAAMGLLKVELVFQLPPHN